MYIYTAHDRQGVHQRAAQYRDQLQRQLAGDTYTCTCNNTNDALAGVAAEEVIDPRPYCEVRCQCGSFHPSSAYSQRKFKTADNGAQEGRTTTVWPDIGWTPKHNATGDIGFAAAVGGGMGRTAVVATLVHALVPGQQMLLFIKAVARSSSQQGKHDNTYKLRIKKLLATGEVLASMLPLLRRCGFNAVLQARGQSLDNTRRALGFITTPYQQVLDVRREAEARA